MKYESPRARRLSRAAWVLIGAGVVANVAQTVLALPVIPVIAGAVVFFCIALGLSLAAGKVETKHRNNTSQLVSGN